MKTFFMKKRKPFLLSIVFFFCIFVPLFPQQQWYTLCFTVPGAKAQSSEELVLEVFAGARKSIHAAVYDLNAETVARSLIGAKKRGVDVRLVTDNSNMKRRSVELLRENGIEVVSDEKGGLMHNKFAVIDSSLVLTGSLNYTGNGFYKNNNNLLLLRSAHCAAIYGAEFDEMFRDRIFQRKTENRKKGADDYYFKAGAVPVNVYFSPEDDIERILCARIAKARTSLRFLAFSFTSPQIAEEMIAAAKKGVRVTGVFEKKGTGSAHSQFGRLKSAGLDVRADGNPHNMHHKLLIIDGETVVVGSYNFTRNAARANDENVIIAADTALAAEFGVEFNRVYALAQ